MSISTLNVIAIILVGAAIIALVVIVDTRQKKKLRDKEKRHAFHLFRDDED